MELALTVWTMLYAQLRFNSMDMLFKMSVRIIQGLMIFMKCLTVPIIRLRALRKRPSCPPITNKLLFVSATELARRIRNRELTSEELVSAYIERCREVNPVLNAIVQDRYDIALQEAREVDEAIRSGSKSQEEMARDTPLLGLPVTVKESIGVKGMSHRAGMVTLTPGIAPEDAEVVMRVRAAGGIFILVSNTPELCMCWETYNSVTGLTLNPYDTRRTPGGSSGGEAALLGSGASLLSLSSDIGGSARLPAMFCGVFGHKPTPYAVSTVGHMPGCGNDPNLLTFFTIGPMVRYVEDLPLLLKSMIVPDGPKLKLDRKVPLKEMKFYYMEDDGGSMVTKSIDSDIKDGIRRLVKHLDTVHGIKAQKVDLEEMKYSFEISATMLLDLDPEDTIFTKSKDSKEWKSVSTEVLRYMCLMSQHILSNVMYGVCKRVFEKIPRSHVKRMMEKNAALLKQLQELLGDNGVLIYPTFPSAAHYPYEIYHKICDVSYMMIFNSLGLPVTQCPIGLNRDGLPIGIQIVGNAQCDHLTIEFAKEVGKVFGGWHPPRWNDKTV